LKSKIPSKAKEKKGGNGVGVREGKKKTCRKKKRGLKRQKERGGDVVGEEGNFWEKRKRGESRRDGNRI